MSQCLALFPVLRPGHRHVSMNSNRRETDEFRRKVGGIRRGEFISGHAFFSDSYADVVEANQVTCLLMVRDPRDVVTSHFHYVTEKNTGHRLNDHYRALPDDHARLMASIRGVEGQHTADGDRLESIGEWFDRFMRWAETPYTKVVRFEDLVGPKGGGEKHAQVETVEAIANHLGIDVADERIEYIADNTFSPRASTFRKGVIGDWENHFSAEHVSALKDEVGSVLVELGYESDVEWTV